MPRLYILRRKLEITIFSNLAIVYFEVLGNLCQDDSMPNFNLSNILLNRINLFLLDPL